MSSSGAGICILMDYYRDPWAGTESQVLKLVEGLRKRHVKVKFVVLRGSTYTDSGLFPIPVEVLDIQKIASVTAILKIIRLGWSLKRQGIGLVHIFFNDASVLAPPLLRLLGIRCLISRRDMGFWYTPAYRRMLPITGRFVSGAICNSRAVATITGQIEQLPEAKLKVIYNGYPDLNSGNPKLGITDRNSNSVRVGIVANLRPIKRIGDAIDALSRVRAKGVNMELHLVGGGDDELLRHQALRLGVEQNCFFWGQRKNVDDFVAGFDIALLTSESEGFSNSIIEYMRNAKPVVCTDTGGNSEIVEHGVNGFLYPVGNVKRLADQLIELAEQPERRKQMGLAGQRKVLNDYSIERMLDEHLELYARTAKAAGKEIPSHAR